MKDKGTQLPLADKQITHEHPGCLSESRSTSSLKKRSCSNGQLACGPQIHRQRAQGRARPAPSREPLRLSGAQRPFSLAKTLLCQDVTLGKVLN